MKTKLSTIILLFLSITTFAQNDLKARVEYEEAETAFAAEDYATAVTHLTEAEKLLGKWTPKIAYLLILSIDRKLDYFEPNVDRIKLLRKQLNQYMAYTSANKDVDMDKFKEVNEIDEFLKVQEKRYSEGQDADYIVGLECIKNWKVDGQINNAVTSFQKATKKGNSAAMFQLAKVYLYYDNFIDKEKGVQLYFQAAEKGNTDAMNEIAKMYHYGNYEKKVDREEAKKYYHEALKYGNAEYVAYYVLNGYGDPTVIATLTYKAATRGSIPAMEYLASFIYKVGYGSFKADGAGVQKWYHHAIDKGSLTALTGLGEYFEEKGHLNEAISYYQKAFEKKYWKSDWLLARSYYKQKNYEKSIIHFQNALGSNMVEYMLKTDDLFYIADSYFKLGNYSKAMEYYIKTYDKGSTTQKQDATTKIAQMYEEGLGVLKDKKLAKEWRNK